MTRVDLLMYLQVLPAVVKLYASNDRAVRVGLLQHIDQYGDSLSSQIVDDQVCSYDNLSCDSCKFR